MSNKKVFIIAEAGVNHNGSLRIAKKMVDVAKKAGADAVKFQTFDAKSLACASAPKAGYQKKNTSCDESQLDMLKKLQFGEKEHKEILEYCQKKGIIFLSSPFDLNSVDMLKKLGLKTFKVPSSEITDLPYLKKIGKLRKNIIMSVGMSTLKEVEKALSILNEAGTPKGRITILHCNTEYPTPIENVNLMAMQTIKDKFGVEVGYSDHTLGTEVPVAAVALGAKVIEKHFTLDKNMEGPDHTASLDPQELKEMVTNIRNIEKALGKNSKDPSAGELRNRKVVLKSIVASMAIKKGDILTEENLTTKRPGTGISPMKWDDIVGKTKAAKSLTSGEMIRQKDVVKI